MEQEGDLYYLIMVSSVSPITTPWTPCLADTAAETYRQLLPIIDHTIVTQLRQSSSGMPAGIMDGQAGSLLYLFHSAVYQEQEALYDEACHRIDLLVENISVSSPPSLCSGLPGIIWLLNYLDRQDILEVPPHMIQQDIVGSLCDVSMSFTKTGSYDFMHMGLGMPLVLLSSPAYTQHYRTFLEQTVAALAATAVNAGDHGLYWTYQLGKDQKEDISLGLSHGLPSIISLLSKLLSRGICPDQCRTLIAGASEYLISRKNAAGGISIFPSLVESHRPHTSHDTRLGWCYGDMGIACAFIHAAHATQEQRYQQEADTILSHLKHRKEQAHTAVRDASFCHGSWGTAHIFNRFYQYTQDNAFRDLTTIWLEKALQMTQYRADHLAVLRVTEETTTWNDHPDVLNGIAGAGLSILSTIAPIRPEWDEVFLLDIN